jgi:hypothetical protein
MRLRRSVAHVLSPLLIVLGLTFIQAQPVCAQTGAQGAMDSEAVAKKLAAMEARIAQLEAQLKSNGTAAPAVPAPVAPVQPAPAAMAVPQAPAQTAPMVAEAALPVPQAAPEATPAAPAKIEPFSDWDWTWLNGNPRNKDVAFDSKFFTPEIRADITYTYDFNKPIDDSMGGSSELFRANEIQLEQLGLGGDFHYDNVRARFMTQFGSYSTATIRNDPSPAKGQWDLADADRYLAEAYGGYHLNVLHGINLDAGIFMSYVGLFSYYNFDNWAYQPSYVSSNTPWFFQGIRIQIFPTAHLKIEPWIINGWQSYGSSNSRKGLGGQIKWTPKPWVNILSNNYGLGHDDFYTPNRGRVHTDNSIEIKYYDKPKAKFWDKSALTLTLDAGCEFGKSTTTAQGVYLQGVGCHGNTKDANAVASFNAGTGAGQPYNPKQSFIGFMLYDRNWFKQDKFAITVGGGEINNPGRYLVLVPPINGETAASAALSSPYFSFNPGNTFVAWDSSITFDWMPRQWLTFRTEYDFRHANVPYWSGHGGMTPPNSFGYQPGTNNGSPQLFACMDGTAVGSVYTTMAQAQGLCGSGPVTPTSHGGLWTPDLRRDESLIDVDWMVKF